MEHRDEPPVCWSAVVSSASQNRLARLGMVQRISTPFSQAQTKCLLTDDQRSLAPENRRN